MGEEEGGEAGAGYEDWFLGGHLVCVCVCLRDGVRRGKDDMGGIVGLVICNCWSCEPVSVGSWRNDCCGCVCTEAFLCRARIGVSFGIGGCSY